MAKTRTDVTDKIAAIEAKTYADTIAGKLESIEDHTELLGIETSYLGLTADNPKLAASTVAVAGIIKKEAVTTTVTEGNSVTVPAGFYSADSVITGVAGGGHYELQAKTVTPTESTQSVTPDEGYYGISSVTVDPIPTKYKDTTDADAVAANVLDGKKFVNGTGIVTGTMPNNGVVNQAITTISPRPTETMPGTFEYNLSLASGYYANGSKVSTVAQDKTVTPTESVQTISGTGNTFLRTVTVNAINVQNVLNNHTVGTAVAGDIFVGKTAWVNGAELTGTMPDQSDWDAAAHIITTNDTGEFSVAIPQGWHDGTGTVKVDAQNKTASAIVPGGAIQTITADAGKVLNQVIVPALDSKYQDVSGVTAIAAHVCAGYKFVDSSGTLITGTLADKGALTDSDIYSELLASGSSGATFLTGTEGHYTSVNCAISADLYNRLAAI